MGLILGVGESDFAELRKEKEYYVDKTEILYELVHETKNKVTLFTRPRRFGKTLMMSMLENFFSIRKDSEGIFEGLAISEHKEFCEEWRNKYPVIFISFKDVQAENFEDAYEMLKESIADLCKKLPEIEKDPDISTADRETFSQLTFRTPDYAEVKSSLKTIMRLMNAVYGKKVILLIDEYDVPLAYASEKNTEENQYYPKMLDVIRGIMSTALKDNEFLQFAVITGCLRIAKESIFTGTNNFASYSVIDEIF